MQTVKEYEGHWWGGPVGGCFITHYYNNLLFCFAFVIFISFFFLFSIVIGLKHTKNENSYLITVYHIVH